MRLPILPRTRVSDKPAPRGPLPLARTSPMLAITDPPRAAVDELVETVADL